MWEIRPDRPRSYGHDIIHQVYIFCKHLNDFFKFFLLKEWAFLLCVIVIAGPLIKPVSPSDLHQKDIVCNCDWDMYHIDF